MLPEDGRADVLPDVIASPIVCRRGHGLWYLI